MKRLEVVANQALFFVIAREELMLSEAIYTHGTRLESSINGGNFRVELSDLFYLLAGPAMFADQVIVPLGYFGFLHFQFPGWRKIVFVFFPDFGKALPLTETDLAQNALACLRDF